MKNEGEKKKQGDQMSFVRKKQNYCIIVISFSHHRKIFRSEDENIEKLISENVIKIAELEAFKFSLLFHK